MHLLSLPDLALTSIFLSLESDVLYDPSNSIGETSVVDEEARSDSRNLAICCIRLHSIFRNSVKFLSLKNSLTPSQCDRLLSLYTQITTLKLSLHSAQILKASDATRCISPRPWSRSPEAYPHCLIARNLKLLQLCFCKMHVRGL